MSSVVNVLKSTLDICDATGLDMLHAVDILGNDNWRFKGRCVLGRTEQVCELLQPTATVSSGRKYSPRFQLSEPHW